MENIYKEHYHFVLILQPPLTILEKNHIFSKKPKFFPKNPKIHTILEILLFQSHSTAFFYTFVINKNLKSESDISVGHYQLATKRKNNACVEWMIFLPYYEDGRKIVKQIFQFIYWTFFLLDLTIRI